MKVKYFIRMKNGICITVNSFDVRGGYLYMYAEQIVEDNSFKTCIGSIDVAEFKGKFKYIDTQYRGNEFVKIFREI